MIFVFLTSLSRIISRSIHVAANDIISLFLWLNNILLIYIPNVLYLFICQWTLRYFFLQREINKLRVLYF